MGTASQSLDGAESPFEPAPSMSVLPYILLAIVATRRSGGTGDVIQKRFVRGSATAVAYLGD